MRAGNSRSAKPVNKEKKLVPIKALFFQKSTGLQTEQSAPSGEDVSVNFERKDCDLLLESTMQGKGVKAQFKISEPQFADLIIKYAEKHHDFSRKLATVLNRIGSKSNDEKIRREILEIDIPRECG